MAVWLAGGDVRVQGKDVCGWGAGEMTRVTKCVTPAGREAGCLERGSEVPGCRSVRKWTQPLSLSKPGVRKSRPVSAARAPAAPPPPIPAPDPRAMEGSQREGPTLLGPFSFAAQAVMARLDCDSEPGLGDPSPRQTVPSPTPSASSFHSR